MVAWALLYLISSAENLRVKDSRQIQPWRQESRKLVPATEELGSVQDIGASLNLPDDVTTAMEQLSKVSFYATGLIGEAAQMPASVAHFQTVVRQPNAPEVFLSLYYAHGASNEGRMQALRGLWHVHPFAYDEIASYLKGQDIGITVMHGCIVEVVPASNVLAEVEVQPLN